MKTPNVQRSTSDSENFRQQASNSDVLNWASSVGCWAFDVCLVIPNRARELVWVAWWANDVVLSGFALDYQQLNRDHIVRVVPLKRSTPERSALPKTRRLRGAEIGAMRWLSVIGYQLSIIRFLPRKSGPI